MELSDQEFEALISAALDELPPKYTGAMSNVAITYDDTPSAEQREKLRLRGDQLLLGLYEGVPLPERGAGYNLILPDKITLFKHPLLTHSRDQVQLKAHIKHTLWHEIAHHFGLSHTDISQAERHA